MSRKEKIKLYVVTVDGNFHSIYRSAKGAKALIARKGWGSRGQVIPYEV